MVKATMQERVSEYLPGLEIAAVQGPQCQLRGDVLHQVYNGSDDYYGDRYRRFADEGQAVFLLQILSPLTVH